MLRVITPRFKNGLVREIITNCEVHVSWPCASVPADDDVLPSGERQGFNRSRELVYLLGGDARLQANHENMPQHTDIVHLTGHAAIRWPGAPRESHAEKGEDVPVKADDHGVDALRYGVKTTRALWQQRIPLPRKVASSGGSSGWVPVTALAALVAAFGTATGGFAAWRRGQTDKGMPQPDKTSV